MENKKVEPVDALQKAIEWIDNIIMWQSYPDYDFKNTEEVLKEMKTYLLSLKSQPQDKEDMILKNKDEIIAQQDIVIEQYKIRVSQLESQSVEPLYRNKKIDEKVLAEELLAKYWYETEYAYLDKTDAKVCEESRAKFRKWIDENIVQSPYK